MHSEPKLIELSNSNSVLKSIYQVRFEPWGERLNFTQFIQREETFAQSSWYRSGLKTWALLLENIVLASCEVFSTNIQSKSQLLSGHLIASVLVEKRHQRNGYATLLLKKLLETQYKDSDFMCLFSEVGTHIYQRCGFVNHPIHRATLAISSNRSFTQMLSVEQLDRNQTLQRWVTSMNNITSPSLSPLQEQLEWQWLRSSFYANALQHKDCEIYGLEMNGSLLVLGYDFKYENLKILHCRRSAHTKDPEWIDLWKAAYSIAQRNRFSSIISWCPLRLEKDINLLSSVFDLQISEEGEDLPMFHFKDGHEMNLDIEYQSWA